MDKKKKGYESKCPPKIFAKLMVTHHVTIVFFSQNHSSDNGFGSTFVFKIVIDHGWKYNIKAKRKGRKRNFRFSYYDLLKIIQYKIEFK